MASDIERKLALAATFISTNGGITNAWSPDDIDKLEIEGLDKWDKVVKDCRFFYRRDPIASTVIVKTMQIGVTDIVIEQGKISDNEFRVFKGIEKKLKKFMKICALEYLISGLVIPEIKYAAVSKDELMQMGVKKILSMQLPVMMWLRDPSTIEIKDTLFGGEPSYYVVIPDLMIFFITNKGKYPDGTKDEELYNKFLRYYPEIVAKIENGERKILLENKLIVRRLPITGNPYPTPYLYPALESLKHKRNIRRMDYSLASRVITAIQLFRLGDKDFPITEDDEDAFDAIRNQMTWRNTSGRDIERIFQLFANHTLQIDWVMPDVATLLDDRKYTAINQDIFYSLGFPKILTTGETERSQSSNAEFATMSPEESMRDMQDELLPILRNIVFNISELNGMKDIPDVHFKDINLTALKDFYYMMSDMYKTGNLSRETFLDEFGFDFEEELENRKEEDKALKAAGVGPFAPQAFSPSPDTPPTDNNSVNNSQNDKQNTPQNNQN